MRVAGPKPNTPYALSKTVSSRSNLPESNCRRTSILRPLESATSNAKPAEHSQPGPFWLTPRRPTGCPALVQLCPSAASWVVAARCSEKGIEATVTVRNRRDRRKIVPGDRWLFNAPEGVMFSIDGWEKLALSSKSWSVGQPVDDNHRLSPWILV